MRHLLLYIILLVQLPLSAQTWSPVGSGITGSFTQLFTYNNKLYAAGIDSLNGKHVTTCSWNGKIWQPADSGLRGTITAMALYEGKLYAGTTEKTGANAVYRLMMWNDTTWTKISTLNGPINALCAFKGSLYAGGKFTYADTTKVKYLARWNDTTWYAVGRNLSNNVRAIAVYRNKLYAGGQFGEVSSFNGRSWEMVTGSPNSIHMGGYVKAFCNYNDALYACGEFNYLAVWDGTDWNSAGSTNDAITTMTQNNSIIYIGGDFISVPNSDYANHVASFDGPSNKWNCLGGVFYSGGDCKPYSGTVWALAVYNGELYVGGQFMIAGGKIISNIARYKIPQ